jgi:hypothetical protein
MTISEPEVSKLLDLSKHILTIMKKWFIANKLTLNFNKMNFIKSASNKNAITDTQISYNTQYIQKTKTMKFLCLHADK